MQRYSHRTGAMTMIEAIAGPRDAPRRGLIVAFASVVVLVSLGAYVASQFNAAGKIFGEMFEIDRLRPVNVRTIGKRRVDVPAGEFDDIGIQHQAEGSKRVTTLWCARELDYLPVIIEQHRKGKLKVRATLTEYRPASAD